MVDLHTIISILTDRQTLKFYSIGRLASFWFFRGEIGINGFAKKPRFRDDEKFNILGAFQVVKLETTNSTPRSTTAGLKHYIFDVKIM